MNIQNTEQLFPVVLHYTLAKQKRATSTRHIVHSHEIYRLAYSSGKGRPIKMLVAYGQLLHTCSYIDIIRIINIIRNISSC